MKRGTRHHTKTNRLMRALKCNRAMATGILESLWHVTSAEAPAGDIGKLSDEDIAEHVDCGYPPSELIPALIGAGWIDISQRHRLVIHDWHDHADDATKKRLERSKTPFVSISADNGGQRRTTADVGGQNLPALPEPEPCLSLAKPSPNPPSALEEIMSEGAARARAGPIYGAYPRKVGKGAAIKAIAGAIRRLERREATDRPDDASAWLLARTLAYAASPLVKTSDPKYIPHPSTWFNEDRFDDDQTEWQRVDGVGAGTNGTGRGADGRRAERAAREYTEDIRLPLG